MTIRVDSAQEMLTILPKKLKLSGSDDEFQDEIEEIVLEEGRVKYLITPWDLSCVLRQVAENVFIDLYQGRKGDELVSLRIA
jgi:hypothetical protein